VGPRGGTVYAHNPKAVGSNRTPAERRGVSGRKRRYPFRLPRLLRQRPDLRQGGGLFLSQAPCETRFRMRSMNWLVKEEPTHYGFDALLKDKTAVWSGVRNALAQKYLRAIKKGDRILYYHTGDEKAVVGIAKALSDAY